MSSKEGLFSSDTRMEHNMLEGLIEPADDTEYDKLNSETFGDDLLNWEECNDKSPQCEKESIDFENNQLSKRVASIILDDEDEDPLMPTRPSRTSSNQTGKIWDANKISKVFTVEEIESEMRRLAEMNKDCGARTFEPSPNNTEAANRSPSAPLHVQNKPIPSRHPNEMQDVFHHRYPAPYNNMSHFPQRPHHQGLGQRPPGPLPPPHLRLPSSAHLPYVAPPRMRRPFAGHPQFNNQYHHVPPNQHPGINHHVGYFNQQTRGYNMPASSSSQQPLDEYAGLMRPQEKQWLQSIQAMQLSGNQPLQNDYYYVMYNNNRQGNIARRMGNFNVRNAREVARPTSTYTPQQFENSLGKLQIGSVTAPRKIIDMDVVENPNIDTHSKPEKKSKQQLMEIEEMFYIVMQLEELENPLFTPPRVVNENLDHSELQEKIMNALLPDNKLVAVMSIRKGRKLVSRLLPVIANTAPLVHKLLMDLVPITRKDTDQTLLLFSPYVRSYVDTVSLSTLVEITSKCTTNFLLSTKFTTSVMAKIVERAWQVFDFCTDMDVEEQWKKELVRLAESTDHWVEENRPIIAIDRKLLTEHLLLIDKQVDVAHITRLVRALGKTPQAVN